MLYNLLGCGMDENTKNMNPYDKDYSNLSKWSDQEVASTFSMFIMQAFLLSPGPTVYIDKEENKIKRKMLFDEYNKRFIKKSKNNLI